MELEAGEKRRLQLAVATKVNELESNRSLQPEIYRSLYLSIKSQFGVDSYKEIKREELQEAIRYIEAWQPRKVS